MDHSVSIKIPVGACGLFFKQALILRVPFTIIMKFGVRGLSFLNI